MVKFKLKANIKRDESGVVSLIVVSVLAVILGLLSVSFSHLSDRELRQASDRELAAQAFYAAESGINDARAYLEKSGTSFSGCTNWPASGNAYFVNSLTSTAKYSCVSIDTTPPNLSYSLNAGESKTIKISQNGLQNLFFGWQNQGYANNGLPLSNNPGTLPQESDPIFNPNTGNNVTGVLRIDIYPVPANHPTTNDALSQSSRTYFLYPNDGAGVNGTPGQVSYASGSYSLITGPGGSNGSFVLGNCINNNTNPVSNPGVGARYCNSEITSLNFASLYYVRLTAEYQPLDVAIQATNAGLNPLNFQGAQAVVDVTGNGTDVLQRVRGRVDLSTQFQTPTYALQSMQALCKGFEIEVDQGGYGGINQVLTNNDGACAAPNGNSDFGSSAGDLGPH